MRPPRPEQEGGPRSSSLVACHPNMVALVASRLQAAYEQGELYSLGSVLKDVLDSPYDAGTSRVLVSAGSLLSIDTAGCTPCAHTSPHST